jgi:hypothetical protein
VLSAGIRSLTLAVPQLSSPQPLSRVTRPRGRLANRDKRRPLSYLSTCMTPEERLDRLERIAKLLVRAGLRARREMRQQDDKLTIMVDAQIKNEERFATLAETHADLAESQAQTNRRLDELIDIVKENRNGKRN